MPHPNVPSGVGPEVDAVVDDPGALVYVEAKWDADIGTGKGLEEGKLDDQIVLRRRSLRAAYAKSPDSRSRVVLGVSRVKPDLDIYLEEDPSAPPVLIRWLTWHDLAECSAHPYAEEFKCYLAWKEKLAA